MSTIVKASVPADQFALAETFRRVPDVEFRVIRLVAHATGHAMPFLWADCDDVDRLYDAVSRDASVSGVDLLEAFDGECLLRLDWGSPVSVFITILGETDATVLEASGHDGTWHLQMLFPDSDVVTSTCECCEDYGIDVSIERANRLSEASEYGHLGLTERQYDTLVAAYRLGYYDVPRRVSQEELAEHFDVSHQALSERLRRGHRTLFRNALNHRVHRRDHSISPQMRTEIDP